MGGAGKCLSPSDPASQWPYCPSYPAAIAFAALFGALTAAHLTLGVLYRKPFSWVIIMAVAWETISYIFRVLGAQDMRVQRNSIVANILVLLAPLWINAFVYMMLGRMAYYWLPEKRLWKLKARTLTRWFVWADVVSFFVQASGGGMLDSPQTSKIGQYIYMGGIGLQEFFVLIFVCLMIKFHIEVRDHGIRRPESWVPMLYSLYVTLFLITVRIIFRLVEFSSGPDGPIPHNESYLYGLEATPMLLAIFFLALFHPGRYLRGPDSDFSKLLIEKGARRWWCCGLRKRTKTDPDFELEEAGLYRAKKPLKGGRRARREEERYSAHSEASARRGSRGAI